jgi:glutathione S-transferase
MVTRYGFGRIFRRVIGETLDLRALEEAGLPYRMHSIDHTGGELQRAAYQRINFRLLPASVSIRSERKRL